MTFARHIAAAAIVLATVAPLARSQDPPRTVTAGRLRSLLEAFAHDSMEGRKTGTPGNARAADYIVRELTRLHIAPGAGPGGYYQSVPLRGFQLDLPRATLQVNGERYDPTSRTLPPGIGFLPLTGAFGFATPRAARVPQGAGPNVPFDGGGYVDFVVGGRLGETAAHPKQIGGKIVLLSPPLRANGQPDYQLWNVRAHLAEYSEAAAMLIPTLDLMPRAFVEYLTGPQFELAERVAQPPALPPIVAVVPSIGDAFANKSLTLAAITYGSRALPIAAPTRNVVALIEGSDPRLRSEYVVLSAHFDHLGVAGARDRVGGDSVFNGASDGGTGAMALVAIAERIASMSVKPKRSVLFLWTVGGEQGMLGAEYFADKPSVPRERIVANITLDEIGSGRPAAQRHTANVASFGAECDGDDWHFARWGIPSVRVSTGRNTEYHRVTDDVARIDFENYARVASLGAELVMAAANGSMPAKWTGAKPDPKRGCLR